MVSLWLAWVCLVQTSGMLSHVDRYEVVRPRRLEGRQKRSLRDNQFPKQLYPDAVQYELAIEGRNHTIHLEKNRNLIGRGYTETHYSEDGKRVTASPKEDHCYYHGHVEGMEDSSVSVGICSGVSGFVRARQQVYLIEPLGPSEDADHAVYRPEHLKIGSSAGCGSSSNSTPLDDQDPAQGPRLSGLFKSRSWKTKPVPGPQRFLELFVVVDNTELYRPLNIRIMLVGLEIWTYRDYIEVDSNSETTLDNFLVWRQADLLQRTKHDNAQFDHHDNPTGLASTVAHEMGHNFGLSHDAEGCMCGPFYSRGNCVMVEKLRMGNQAFPEFFSGCSMEQLAEFMERAQPSCLSKPGSVRTIAAGPSCGNALLDPGEECDCGTVEECTNLCCDASTCRLTSGSQCAHGQCCDNCQSAGDCDLPEYCTGASEVCPEDSFEMNGKPCFHQAQGYCYNGRCPTHQQHCWRLFGPGGGESITGKRAAYTVNSVACNLAVDDDKTRNIDMVPEGTRCGPDKVCLDYRCVDVSVYGKEEDCAKKCNNNGVCNHKKECHCNPGWAPPYCDIQYTDLPQGRSGIIAGVCAALSIILVITVVIAGLMCCKKDNVDNYAAKRKVHSAPDKFQGRPQISQPTFMESTATQAYAPLIVTVSPSRAAPQPPKNLSSVSFSTSQTEPNKTARPSPPPVPPVKPRPPLPPAKPQTARCDHGLTD
ncbi:hypothetical protein FQN60_002842 [Etheostoma spectabile]|uniref:Disintegrin domain-containing protein n=1 Tax=Etheostoma spectabile TaxID=54343 RepID=A0A5J5CMR3_9PERO|nr:hypothetical protein FQN60_002842 [Etheostoma spectabile]